ncbi:MAG: RNase adapter RapZ [Betaproteobacteria bacterium]|nr:RNase adapter RapZ [Betaproteobacteria bacterium]
MQLILISGLSGSGKSVALKALEDAGYFAVDNLPATLIGQLLQWVSADKVAVSVDARSASTLQSLPVSIAELTQRGIDCRVVFLDSSNAALTRRFSETRRPHPLADRFNGIDACIAEERRLLAEVAELAHRLDTSDVAPNTLRGWIKDWLKLDRNRITLAFESFGFKHGIPSDADFVFDVRFLPNPFYDPALKPLTGNDEPVIRFLQDDLNVSRLIDDVASFILRWLPSFMNDNRNAITIAIGCTGGQHRSVYVVNQLAERFGSEQQVLVRHRELGNA